MKDKIRKARNRLTRVLVGEALGSWEKDIRNLKEQNGDLRRQIRNLQRQVERLKELDNKINKYISPEKYEELLSDMLRQKAYEVMDWKTPKTFNQKMQWLKLYNNTPEKTRLTDKYLVRSFIKEVVGEKYLVPLLGVYDSFDEIDFDSLPRSFVMKANHGCGMNIIVKDKTKFDRDDARKKINYWLSYNFAYRSMEMHYKDIQPKIIIEKYIEFQAGIEDYKFYCFDGQPKYMLAIADRYTDEKMAFYDMKMQKQDISILPGMKDLNIKRPKQFDAMLELTKKFTKKLKYPMLRVDWYIDKKGDIYCGEITFTPGSGFYRFQPDEQNRAWGDMMTLPKKSK